jgi:peroxiredoxin Q/BCP
MLNSLAPDFSLESTIGQPISNADLKGAFAVLIFYPANDTPTCNKQLSDADLELSSFMSVNARVFGINTAGIEKQKEYCVRRRISFPILSDPGGKVAKLYGAKLFGLPLIIRTVVVIDPNGSNVYHKRGNNPPPPAEILEAIQDSLSKLSSGSTPA